MASLKISGARYVVTLDPERRIIRDGSVLIEDQRIAQVGKATELEMVPADRVVDAGEMVVTPGFCNGHMHVSYAHAVRGVFPDDLDPGYYLANVFKLQSAMTEEEEYYTSLLGITELLKYGTTTFLDPGSTKYLDACMQAYEESGCRIVSGAQVVDLPNPLGIAVSMSEEAISATEHAIRTYDHRLGDRMRIWAMPFDASHCTGELLAALKKLADTYGTGMTIHQMNRASDVDFHFNKSGMRPVEYLEDIGVSGPNVLLSHVVGLSDSEVECMARTGTKGVMVPTAALKMGVGTVAQGKLPEMLDKGVCVGLGTDAGNNSNLVETMRSMYLVAVLYKDGRRTTGTVPAEKALEMATIDGARALGLENEIGSIEPGKKADLVLFDTRRPEWRSILNPVNNLVYNADGRSVHTVLVDGRVVVEDHRPTFVDEWQLIQRVQDLGEGLLARTGVSFPSRWPVV